jgi:hypothetical protein
VDREARVPVEEVECRDVDRDFDRVAFADARVRVEASDKHRRSWSAGCQLGDGAVVSHVFSELADIVGGCRTRKRARQATCTR